MAGAIFASIVVGVCLANMGGGGGGGGGVLTVRGVAGIPEEPGPKVRATSGEVWPKPMIIRKQREYLVIRPEAFEFVVTGSSCPVLDHAIVRYERILIRESQVLRARDRRGRKLMPANRQGRQGSGSGPAGGRRGDRNFRGFLPSLSVNVTGDCESWPLPDMDEEYTLAVEDSQAKLTSASVWGALRGLETFVQLVSPGTDGSSLIVNQTEVVDRPRFPHRGLLVDTSRHYLTVQDLKRIIDGMEAVKMNVLHWHIVDDQSFPWQSTTFPELSKKGAYDPSLTYRPVDVKDVLDYARLRGVRVLAEFDTPGHTRSWGLAIPGLLSACHDRDGYPTGAYANIDPTKPANLEFLRQLFKEVAASFPDPMLHLGGDEVPNYCWDSDPGVQDYMENRNMTGNFRKLESDYLRWLVREVQRLNRTPIVWQEAWQNGDYNPSDVIVQVWLGNAMDLLSQITAEGFRALLSESWYLDTLHSGGDWERMYSIEPLAFPGSDKQRALVQGGEACMWGEVVDSVNVHSRVWPRSAAVAERLWSPRSTVSLHDARRRIEELVCRMRRRAVPAQPPNGPGFCLM